MLKKNRDIASFFKPKAKNEPLEAPIKPEIHTKPQKIVREKFEEKISLTPEQIEQKLRDFDNCVAYGPVIGKFPNYIKENNGL